MGSNRGKNTPQTIDNKRLVEMEARVGIGEGWLVLPLGNLFGRVQACLSRLKPTQARNGSEVRVRVRVWGRSLINCSSNPIATGEAKWIPPSPEFPSCSQLGCGETGVKVSDQVGPICGMEMGRSPVPSSGVAVADLEIPKLRSCQSTKWQSFQSHRLEAYPTCQWPLCV